MKSQNLVFILFTACSQTSRTVPGVEELAMNYLLNE